MRGRSLGQCTAGMTDGKYKAKYWGRARKYIYIYQYKTGNIEKLPQIDEDKEKESKVK
jgi:hypothetical protein